MKIFTLILSFSLSTFYSINAAVTYQFSVSGINRATGFAANGSSVGTDAMRYGLVFDTNGNGFAGFNSNGNAPSSLNNGVYDLFTNTASGFLTAGNAATGDYYWVPSNASPFTNTLTSAGSDTGGAGGILSATVSPVGTDAGLPSGLTAGDKFAIIWFQTIPAEGSYYGLFTDASFVMPASGSTPVEFNSPFLGSNDPIKTANLSFAAVPEPSRVVLFGFGLIGLFFRRRR